MSQPDVRTESLDELESVLMDEPAGIERGEIRGARGLFPGSRNGIAPENATLKIGRSSQLTQFFLIVWIGTDSPGISAFNASTTRTAARRGTAINSPPSNPGDAR